MGPRRGGARRRPPACAGMALLAGGSGGGSARRLLDAAVGGAPASAPRRPGRGLRRGHRPPSRADVLPARSPRRRRRRLAAARRGRGAAANPARPAGLDGARGLRARGGGVLPPFHQPHGLIAHGLPTGNTVMGMHALADHMELLDYVIALLLRLHSGPETLLLVQAVAAASAVFPLGWLAARLLEGSRARLAVAAV